MHLGGLVGGAPVAPRNGVGEALVHILAPLLALNTGQKPLYAGYVSLMARADVVSRCAMCALQRRRPMQSSLLGAGRMDCGWGRWA